MKKTPNILTIGEILWDMLPEGPQLGGAPANFTFYCHELGANTQLAQWKGSCHSVPRKSYHFDIQYFDFSLKKSYIYLH